MRFIYAILCWFRSVPKSVRKKLFKKEKCLFCENLPDSEEHVFLSSLGGRLSTRHATCNSCNNALSLVGDETLAIQMAMIRCALMIWTGRDKPPPSIRNAGQTSTGASYDLGPGLVPLVNKPVYPPKTLTEGMEVGIVARTQEEARKILDSVNARGFAANIQGAFAVSERVGTTKHSMSIGGEGVLRSVARTALTGATVLFGNSVQVYFDKSLLNATRRGAPDIMDFVGHDYVNPWPQIAQFRPHERTPGATQSGFEHTLVIGDVECSWIAYVELFGGYRFSAYLGACSGLPTRGIAINPRAMKAARFELTVRMPASYIRRYKGSLADEREVSMRSYATATERILGRWSSDQNKRYVADNVDELMTTLSTISTAEEREKALATWLEKVAALEFGGSWKQELDRNDFA